MTQPSTRRRPQGPTGSTRRSAGFTLIELMIAVAIVGILASIAYPSYQRYVQDARRADAKASMTEWASRIERCFTEVTSYQACVDQVGSPSSDFYSFSYDQDETSAFSYLITASSVRGDRCDPLTLSHRGQRGAAENGCW